MKRPHWDEYHLLHAQVAALRGQCPRKQVGAVLTYQNEPLATGYNGAPKGKPTCEEAGCLIQTVDGNETCYRAIHAEINALMLSQGRWRPGMTLYVTHLPCWSCFNAVVQAGVTRVLYITPMKDRRAYTCASAWGVALEQAVPRSYRLVETPT